jgi:hypothetical protein
MNEPLDKQINLRISEKDKDRLQAGSWSTKFNTIKHNNSTTN